MQRAGEYREFIATGPDVLWRSHAVGHITASALVVSDDVEAVLLTLHPKVGRWLQLGGHLEIEDASLRLAALREVEEECGFTRGVISRLPIRLDRHPVPCGRLSDGSALSSTHWDVQFVVRVAGTPVPRISSESDDLRWFVTDEIPSVDDSVQALIADARQVHDWVSFG
jgi:8-oxo-dGTP pyrophosphatase MutT (NUDIX family)